MSAPHSGNFNIPYLVSPAFFGYLAYYTQHAASEFFVRNIQMYSIGMDIRSNNLFEEKVIAFVKPGEENVQIMKHIRCSK